MLSRAEKQLFLKLCAKQDPGVCRPKISMPTQKQYLPTTQS